MADELIVNIKAYGLGIGLFTQWDLNSRKDCPYVLKFVSHAQYNVLLLDRRRLTGNSEMNVGKILQIKN